MSYADDVKIFMNIMAQSPEGLNDPQLIGKFSKAKFQLHAMDSMNQMQAQQPMPQPTGGTISPPMGNSTTSEPLGATGMENQPMQDEGQGTDQVPPTMQ